MYYKKIVGVNEVDVLRFIFIFCFVVLIEKFIVVGILNFVMMSLVI